MTKDKDFKRLARARSTRTGESYSTARRNLSARSDDTSGSRQDYWFSRASQGYGGMGAKATGFEHHVVGRGKRGIQVESEASFRNYGIHRFTITADSASHSSIYTYAGGAITVRAELNGAAWTGIAIEETIPHQFSFELVTDVEVVPSVVARFLPLTLARDTGELASYLPVPEDGFPAWRPISMKSWFPVMGPSRDPLTTARVIIGRGQENLRMGRTKVAAYRYDHVDRSGTLQATTWTDEEDEVVRYEQRGLTLSRISAEKAHELDPCPEDPVGG